LTSSDVVDTALCATLTQAMDIVITEAIALRDALTRRAVDSIDIPITGRTHGMHAEPTTFGAKFALFALQVSATSSGHATRERQLRLANSPARSARSPTSILQSKSTSVHVSDSRRCQRHR